MPPNPSVPDIPENWPVMEVIGTPYRLGIVDGDTAWVPTVVLDVVRAEDETVVLAENDRPIFVE